MKFKSLKTCCFLTTFIAVAFFGCSTTPVFHDASEGAPVTYNLEIESQLAWAGGTDGIKIIVTAVNGNPVSADTFTLDALRTNILSISFRYETSSHWISGKSNVLIEPLQTYNISYTADKIGNYKYKLGMRRKNYYSNERIDYIIIRDVNEKNDRARGRIVISTFAKFFKERNPSDLAEQGIYILHHYR